MIITTRIRALRTERGWSQERLAEECGLARTTLSDIENGNRRPRIDTCQIIAEALEVTVDELWPKGEEE